MKTQEIKIPENSRVIIENGIIIIESNQPTHPEQPKELKAGDLVICWDSDEGCAIPLVSGSWQDIQDVIEFLQWVFRKIDKGDTPHETVRMLIMNREKIDNIKFDGNDR